VARRGNAIYPSDIKRKRERYIVGLDGEGQGRDPHRYTLLAYSDISGQHSAHVHDARGLSTRRCLEFLISLPRDARAFGYYLGYDWTMILRDLPDKSLYLLHRPELRARPDDEGGGFSPVVWEDFRLHKLGTMMRVSRAGRHTTIWDVGRFYQCSFVKACKDAGIGLDIIAHIEAMKAARSDFENHDIDSVREYCLAECRLLAELVAELNRAHVEAGIPLRAWHGPGSSATVALNQMGIAEKRGRWCKTGQRAKRGEIPAEMRMPVSSAFFGGRFENRCMGHVAGPIYGADIISAYVRELVELPCLEHARWRYTTEESDIESAEQACVRFEIRESSGDARRVWGPLPIRLPNGCIVFPRHGASGWCWLREYRAARAWSGVRFEAAWILERNCDCIPFEQFGVMFETRQRVGRKSAVGGALKRAYNSGYGKLAQKAGKPKFRSQIWAGMITSGCRAKLAELLGRYDDIILSCATDGIYSTAPLELDVGEGLGQWEISQYDDIVLVRPGIYWCDEDVRSRGLPRSHLAPRLDAVMRAFEVGASEVRLPTYTQFGGAQACVYRTPGGRIKRGPRYGEWYERPARISLDPRPKRRPDWGLWELPGVESRPYDARSPSPEALALLREEITSMVT
jgi:hypothetical protein